MSHTRGGSVVEGQNVVRNSSKRSRLILGAAVASALAGMTASSVRAGDFSWSGGATPPSFWDVPANWIPAGPPTGLDNAIFSAGAVDFGVDLHAATQLITNVTFNNATGSYLLSNGGLNIAGTLTHSGAATNTIGGQVLASGAWNVSGGTLRVTNNSAAAQNNFNSQNITVGLGATLVGNGAATPTEASSLHNANVVLSGGTLRAGGNFANGANQLLGTYYDTAIDGTVPSVKFTRLIPIDKGNGILNMAPDGYNRLTTQLAQSIDGLPVGPFPTQNILTSSGGAITDPNDFAVGYTGTLTVSAANAGTWRFATNSDDGSVLWIDLNHNGKFDWTADPAQRELIVWNNNDQGPTTRENYRIRGGIPAAHPNLNLDAGDYKIAVGWYQGGGGANVIAAFNNNTSGGDPANPATWTVINPGDAGQAGMWSVQNEQYQAKYASTTVEVAAGTSSTVNVDAKSASFGALKINAGSTLNTTGNGPVSFSGTNGTGIITVNTGVDTSAGVLSGGITRLNKTGSATLSIEDTSAASSLVAGNTVSVGSGVLRARGNSTSNTLGAATISLDGGTFAATNGSLLNSTNALRTRWYRGGDSADNLDPIDNLINRPPSHTTLTTLQVSVADRAGVLAAPNSDIRIASEETIPDGGDGAQNYNVLWTGHINISQANAGRYTFATRSDDGSVIYIDLNRDGVFDPNSELIVNNNVYQGPTTRTNNDGAQFLGHSGHPDLDLAAGSYPIAIGTYEGGGGAQMTAIINGPATGNVDMVIGPSLQPGLFSSLEGVDVANFSSSPVVVTADSTLDVQTDTALFGDLTIGSGRTLTFPGVGTALFASTHATGTINIANSAFSDVSTGRIFATGPITINKSGGGSLIIDDTSVASGLVAGSALNLTGGNLVGSHNGTLNSLGSASVSLANAGIILSSKTGGPVTYSNNVSASGNTSVVAAKTGSGGVDNGNVTLSTLTLADGSNAKLVANNGYLLTVSQTNLSGSATLNNNSSDTNITLGNISGVASSVLTFSGANRTRITGNVSGNNVIVNAPVTFDPGAATTKTVGATAQVNNEMRIASGIVDYGQNVISSNAYQAGLLETFANGGFYEGPIAGAPNTFGVPQSVQLAPRRANQAEGNTNGSNPGEGGNARGWTDNSTYIYSGQINVPDNGVADGVGHIAFFMRFDDSVSLKIDGATVMRDTTWNNATSSGDLALSAGWHDIEMRFGEGGGGVGPNWNGPAPYFSDGTMAGVGLQTDPSLGFDTNSGLNGAGDFQAVTLGKYFGPTDNGSMNLFRTLGSNTGTIDIEAGAELKAGGLTALANLNLNGTGASAAKLTLSDHASPSSSDIVNLNVTAGSSVNEVSLGTNTSLTATNISVATGATLTKSGPGTLRASSTLANAGNILISAGKLQANGVGSGAGPITVQSGATLGGSGSVGGPVTVNTGGSLSPHDVTGIATLTLNDALNMDPSARLDFNFGASGDKVNVLANLALTGNSTLNLNAITGFTVGTYRLLTMAGFTNTGDVVIGANNGPLAFNYSIVETAPVGATPGHIDLVVTAQQYKWSGTQNNVWDINGAINWLNPSNIPAKYIDLVAVTMDNSGINRNINITAANVNPASINVNNDATHAYSIGGNPIAGPTGILKQGDGTLTLTGSNSFIGPVTIEAGTVNVNSLANGGSNSALGAGTTPLTLGAAGTGGTLVYSGGVAGSTDRGITLGAGGGTVDSGGQSVSFGGIVSGAGDLTKAGAGTLAVSGIANTMSGSLNVNAGTLSTGSIGAGAPGKVISLGSGATFEYTGANNTDGRGLNNAAGGGTVRVTNAATNLTLNGAVSAPTLSKTGTGTLTLGGVVTYTGTTHSIGANSGTIAYTSAGGNTINGSYGVDTGSTLRGTPGALGTVAVNLNGGTLSLQGASSNRGLNGEFYQFNPSTATLDTLDAFNQALIDNAATLYATASTRLSDLDPRPAVQGAINHIAGGGNPFDQYGGIAAPAGFDNLVTRWTGKIHVGANQAGPITFFSASDDGMKIWIDGAEVVNNNFFQGLTERSGVASLTAGDHDIVIGYYEGGGDANLIVSWTPVGGTKHVVGNNEVFAGSSSANYGNNVSTAAGTTSGIDVDSIGIANLGALNLGNGSTLNINNGGIAFTGTTLAVAGGTYNVNGNSEVNLKQVTGSGTINHSDVGALVFETNNLAGPGAGSVINMTGGVLGAVGDAGMTNPLGAASVNLSSGAAIVLSARTGDVTFDTAVSGAGSVRVNSGALGSGTVGAHTLTLGSVARPLSLAAGSTAALGADFGTSLVLPAIQLAGDAALNNNSSSDNVTIGNINMTASNAKFGGSRQMTLTGNITGTVSGILINNAALNVNPSAGTSNINGPIRVSTILNVNSGTTSVGGNIVHGVNSGILETFVDGHPGDDFYEGPLPSDNLDGIPQSVQKYPRRANQEPGGTNGTFNPDTGWVDNSTYIYSGQINIPDNGTPGDGLGHVAFFMRFDDSTSLTIDGTQVMRDRTWNNATSSGELVLTAGWHDIEMRFGEGGGGVGPNWVGPPVHFADGTPAAIGWQTDPSLGFDPSSAFNGNGNDQNVNINRYQALADDGTGSVLRLNTTTGGGTVNVAAGATLNAGGLEDLQNLNLNGATVNLNAAASHTGAAVIIAANGNAGAVNNISVGANNTLQAQQLTVASGTVFNKNGAGTLRTTALPGVSLALFPNIHDFANDSTVNVNAGKLIIDSTGQAGTGTVNVLGLATLGGGGSITGSVSVAANGHVAPGDSVGMLTVGGMSLNNSILDIEGSAVGIDQIKVNSAGTADVFTLAGNSTVNLFDLGGVPTGPTDYLLIDYNNTVAFTDAFVAAHMHVGTTPAGWTALLVNDAGNQDILLRLSVVPNGAEWNVDASGSWGLATNWNPNTVPDASNAIASFLGKITAARTVTLDGNRTVKNLNFQNANAYTIASGTGGTLTVLSQVNLTLGSHVISAPLAIGDNTTVDGPGTLTASGGVAIGAGKTLTKTGIGTLTLSGAQGHGAGAALAVNRGVVNLNSNAGVPATPASSNLSVSISGSAGNAKVSTGANQDLKELSIPFANAGTQTLDLSSPAGAGQFHSVTVYAANLTAAKAALYNAIVNANQAGAADPNDGITDSGLHSGAKIGLAQTANSIYIRPTKPGDLNLDGAVTISDFIDLASNFNTVGTATWQEGDLNYDHNVTVSDFIDFAANFNSSYTGSAGPISASDAQTLASFASSIGVDPGVIGSAVPEPGTLGLLAIGAMGLMSRRRRKA